MNVLIEIKGCENNLVSFMQTVDSNLYDALDEESRKINLDVQDMVRLILGQWNKKRKEQANE